MPPIDFNGIDSSVHGPIRLGILTALQLDGPLDFTTLKKRLEVSDGAIAPHLKRLEQTTYIHCRKAFVDRKPKSTYRITAVGRRALVNYLNAMQQVIDAMQ